MKQDSLTLQRIELLHPELRDEAKSIYNDICVALNGRAICRFTHTLRTIEEQNKLYAQGRTTSGKVVTKAKGGRSYHNYGMAIDIILLKDTDGNGSFESISYEDKVDFDGDGNADWMECVNIFKKYGWEWGGDWKNLIDKPHFQKIFKHTIPILFKWYNDPKLNKQKFIENTSYLKKLK